MAPPTLAQALCRIPFIVFLGDKLNETAELADVFLPIRHVLERLDFPMNSMRGWVTGAHWYYTLRQPVVEPAPGVRHIVQVFLEMAERLQVLGELYGRLNARLGLTDRYRLDPAARYSLEEIIDRRMKSMFGEERGLGWFRERGVLSVPRALVERFPRGVRPLPRLPVYFEFMAEAGRQLGSLAGELGLELDLSAFQPLPVWSGCAAHNAAPEGYDLFAVNYKLPYHTCSLTQANPWLAELLERDSYALKVMIHEGTAARKGIADGDRIIVESTSGARVEGVARCSQCIHPEVIAIASSLGHWARGLPVARGKGVHFNSLVPYGIDHIDLVSGQVDLCARVRVTKVPARRRGLLGRRGHG